MASSNHLRINQLRSDNKPCTITVRIIRLWKQPVFGNINNIGSLEMILMDEGGHRIQASVKKNVISTFEHLLVEGEPRRISNFFVFPHTGSYKILDHPFKINLHKLSGVKVIDQFSGSVRGLLFASFRDIMDGKIASNTIVDVIGRVSGCGEVISGDRNGKPNKRMDVQIQDMDGLKLKCTFWDSYVDDFKEKFEIDASAVNVMVFQFAKLREWRGEFSISHGFHVARIFLNDEIEEIIEFKKRFVGKFGDESANQKMISLPDPFTEAYFSNTRCVRLDDLDTIYEPTSCVAVAVIKCIETDQPWFYIACRKCNKKVNTKNPDDQIEVVGSVKSSQSIHDCPDCGPDVNVIPRFKVQLKLKDESGEASLVFFDRDVVKLVMKSAHTLMDSCAGAETYPDALEAMVGKKVMVKFDVTQFNIKNDYQVYTVSRMTENEIMFKSFYKLSMIETEFENQCQQAKSAECYNDALDATDIILGVGGSNNGGEGDGSVCVPNAVNVSTDVANVDVSNEVVHASEVATVNANDVDIDTVVDETQYATPKVTKRCLSDIDEDKAIQYAPKKPRKKGSSVQK